MSRTTATMIPSFVITQTTRLPKLPPIRTVELPRRATGSQCEGSPSRLPPRQAAGEVCGLYPFGYRSEAAALKGGSNTELRSV